MKISVLTPTYNRGKLLEQLYNSLKNNSIYGIDIEWLIMDDGSTDNTYEVIQKYIIELEEENNNKLEIKYFKQENQGKMAAINNLVEKATGTYIIECDSDDYFTKDSFKIIKSEIERNDKILDNENIYGLCFLKYDQNGKNMGQDFKVSKTTMFDLYFKQGETGEKAIVFKADIRKKYKHKIEKNERFVTEARMYHEIDKLYNLICINNPIMICEYQNEGYTKNMKKQFLENPKGYYMYFKEILELDMNGVKFNKRLYVIKHYILFEYLISKLKETESLEKNNKIRGMFNKILYLFLRTVGRIKARKYTN